MIDTVFTMDHDQDLTVLKNSGSGSGLIITFGLSFILTSVNHGTAQYPAITGIASASSMNAAFQMAAVFIH